MYMCTRTVRGTAAAAAAVGPGGGAGGGPKGPRKGGAGLGLGYIKNYNNYTKSLSKTQTHQTTLSQQDQMLNKHIHFWKKHGVKHQTTLAVEGFLLAL